MPSEYIHSQHERTFESSRFVYPVISRRAGGLSIGINLNPDKICNFGCIYCQVDRTSQSETRFVELPGLLSELESILTHATSGELFRHPKFAKVPEDLRRLNDIAFSGDGEPTSHKNFDQVVTACAELKRAFQLDRVKMVLITNASLFHREHIRRGLEILDANQGEIWAKLDAGTEEYFRRVDRSPISFQRILTNISEAACQRPLVIQSLFMKIGGDPPGREELTAYCDRLREITFVGGKLQLVQVCTVARRPAESYVSPLSDAQVDEVVRMVEEQTGLPAKPYYGLPA